MESISRNETTKDSPSPPSREQRVRLCPSITESSVWHDESNLIGYQLRDLHLTASSFRTLQQSRSGGLIYTRTPRGRGSGQIYAMAGAQTGTHHKTRLLTFASFASQARPMNDEAVRHETFPSRGTRATSLHMLRDTRPHRLEMKLQALLRSSVVQHVDKPNKAHERDVRTRTPPTISPAKTPGLLSFL